MMTSGLKAHINKLVKRFPRKESAVLPALSLIQKEKQYVSDSDMKQLSEMLNIPEAAIFSTASYYTLLSLQPKGKYDIQICDNIVCSLLDENPLLEHVSKKLDIKPGETTADGLFSLTAVECLAACGYAPVVQINMERYEDLNPEKIDELIDLIREKEALE